MHPGKYQIWMSKDRYQSSCFKPGKNTLDQLKCLTTAYGVAEDGSDDTPMELAMTFWSPSWRIARIVYKIFNWWNLTRYK